MDYGGLYAEQQSSFADLTLVFGAALMLVSLLLLYLFERWSAVLSVIGVVLAAMCAAGRRADDERVRTLREQFEKAYTGPGPRVAVNDARLRAGRKPL